MGSQLEDVLLVAKEVSGRMVLSLKPLLARQLEAAPRTLSDVQEGQFLFGYIRSVTAFGCFVGFVHGLVGLVDMKNLSNHFVADPTKEFAVGQTVLTRVTKLDYAQQRISLSLVFEDPGLVSPRDFIKVGERERKRKRDYEKHNRYIFF